ncbi:hypothetical protein F183_A30200 [Bryobacterales bacterium F-183]|nr:hypothetical protein F183_A30200 [Bryobacterales bacterium F-183]
MKLLFSGLLLAASLSFGAQITYSDYSGWAAPGALGATIGFDSIAAQDNSQTITSNGVSFTGGGAFLRIYSAAFSPANLNGTQSLTGPSGVLNISLPSNIYGVGFLIGTPASGITIVVNGQSAGTITTVAPPVSGAATFWGVRSDVAITSIELVSTQAGFRTVIDNVVLADFANLGGGGGNEPPPGEVPEVSSAVLIGTSLILLPLARKYALRRQA